MPAVIAVLDTEGEVDSARAPAHVPDFLPPFPDPSTYVRTAAYNSREQERVAVRKKRSRHKRQGEESLHALEQRLAGGTAKEVRSASLVSRSARPAHSPVLPPSLPSPDPT